jgi:hypothetical protein
MKIIYNACYGGYGFSKQFIDEYNKRFQTSKNIDEYDESLRTDENAIKLLEEMGSEFSSGYYADLEIAEIPDGVEYTISEYDGIERVKWDVPKNEIIQDLIDLYRLKKTPVQCNPITQTLLSKNLTASQLRGHIYKEFNKNK